MSFVTFSLHHSFKNHVHLLFFLCQLHSVPYQGASNFGVSQHIYIIHITILFHVIHFTANKNAIDTILRFCVNTWFLFVFIAF